MKKTIILSSLFIAFIVSPLRASEEELFFTYVGPTISGGINQIAYRSWSSDTNTRKSTVASGNFFSGGFLINIFVRDFIGEFTLEYIWDMNSEEPDISVQHLIYTSAVKYSYSINDIIALAAGPGVFLETPPATRDYDSGGGFNSTIGAVFDLNREIKIVFDILCRYGYFGMGDDSSKLSWGAKLGMVYKVGRI